jgi:hypothetical protein
VTDDGLKIWYLRLPDSDKLIFLALVMGHLTIHGRAFGIDLSGVQQVRAFKGLNELQHQISNYFVEVGMKISRYPDDAFLRILTEKASYYGLSTQLSQSLEYARARDFWSK